MPNHTIPLLPPLGTLWHQQTSHPRDAIRLHLLGGDKTGIHPWRTHLPSVPVAIKVEHLHTEVGHDAELQSGLYPGEDGEHADKVPCVGFWQKCFACANTVSSALQVVGIRWSHRWRSRMWRFWASVVTCGLRLWGRLYILPNSLKQCCRCHAIKIIQCDFLDFFRFRLS
jgi:hypothetical protein